MTPKTSKRAPIGRGCEGRNIKCPALLLFMLMLALPLAWSFDVGAQTVPNVDVDISQDTMKADISIGIGAVIRYDGNVTVTGGKANGLTFEAEVLEESWTVNINPNGYVPVAGDTVVAFDGSVSVPANAAEGTYELKVSVTVDTPGVYPPAVHHDIMKVTVIKNRIVVSVLEPSVVTITPTNVTQVHVFSFKVINRGSTDDMVSFGLRDEARLLNLGWGLDLIDEEELGIPAGSFVYINVNVTIPANPAAGDYEVTLGASSGKTDGYDQASAKVHVEKVHPVGTPTEEAWSFLGLGYTGWFTVSLAVIGVVMIVVLGGTEIGFFAFLIYILVPLYCRLKKDKILDNFTRGEIFGYIKANPGTHYMEIQNHLDVSNGVLAHHLSVLEREEFIKSNRDGLFKRFYPRHVKVSKKGKHLSRLQKDIIEEIERHPGIVQKTLAKFLGESKQVVSYHIKVLSKADIIRTEKDGSYVRIYSNRSHKARVRSEDVVEDRDEPMVVEAEPVGTTGTGSERFKM
jgi:predicted transcriptional regulator